MLFRSKTAIKVRFQKLFNTKILPKNYHNSSISMELLQSKNQKFSAILTKLSNDYNAEQSDKILG